jgi:hypothetical protein
LLPGQRISYPEDGVPAELANTEPDWSGVRFFRDKGDDPEWDYLDFAYNFHDDPDKGGWRRHLWVYSEESGNPDNVAWLVQKFLKEFRPDQCWSLTWLSVRGFFRCMIAPSKQ